MSGLTLSLKFQYLHWGFRQLSTQVFPCLRMWCVMWVVVICMIIFILASVWMLLLFTSALCVNTAVILLGHQFYICQLISLVCFYFRGTCKIKLNVILYTSGSASDWLVTPQGHRPYYWKPAGELASHKPFNHATIVRTFPPSTPQYVKPVSCR